MGNIINTTIDRKLLNMSTDAWWNRDHACTKWMYHIYVTLRKKLFKLQLRQPSTVSPSL